MTTYKPFDEVEVSTKTLIVTTNLTLDITGLFDSLPLTKYIVIPRQRGRKKQAVIPDPNKDIPDGSIITLELANRIRGVSLKKKKAKGGGARNYFRNSLTVVMVMHGKNINFKVSRNGKFQMTGCKSDAQAEECIKKFWSYIENEEDIYTLPVNCRVIEALFIPAMRNINFELDFAVDREKLDLFFHQRHEGKYFSFMAPSVGYTGVNIKSPLTKPIEDLRVKKLMYRGGKWCSPTFISYGEYLNILPEKEQRRKRKKKRYNTFLVFQTGNVIMSSLAAEFGRDAYEEFWRLLKENQSEIEERLNIPE